MPCSYGAFSLSGLVGLNVNSLKYSHRQVPLKRALKNVGLPDKIHYTVYYTATFLCCKPLKYIHIPATTISSKGVGRTFESCWAGQISINDWNHLRRLWPIIAELGQRMGGLGLAWRILANYGQLGGQ
jgi:hypothetical protein